MVRGKRRDGGRRVPLPGAERIRSSGWVYRDAAAQIERQRLADIPRRARVVEAFRRRPLLYGVTINGTILFVCSIVFVWDPVFLARFAPGDAASVLGLAWQVHATIVAIAFAGLALLFQQSDEKLLTGYAAREALYRQTHFGPILFYCLTGNLQLGATSAWFASDAAVVVEMTAIMVPSLLLIGRAYVRAVSAFTQLTEAKKIGEMTMVRLLRESIDSNRALAVANSELHGVAAHALGRSLKSEKSHSLVSPSVRCVLNDVHLPTLRDIRAELEAATGTPIDTRATSSSVLPGDEPIEDSVDDKKPRILMRFSLGMSVGVGQPVFVVIDANDVKVEWPVIERRLAGAVDWKPDND